MNERSPSQLLLDEETRKDLLAAEEVSQSLAACIYEISRAQECFNELERRQQIDHFVRYMAQEQLDEALLRVKRAQAILSNGTKLVPK